MNKSKRKYNKIIKFLDFLCIYFKKAFFKDNVKKKLKFESTFLLLFH